MKKLLLLVDKKISPKKQRLAEYLSEEFRGRGEVKLATFSDLFCEVRQSKVRFMLRGEEDLKDFDLVYFRRAGNRYFSYTGAITAYLDKHGVKFFDTTLRRTGMSGDKFSMYTRLALEGFPIIDSVFVFREKMWGWKEKIIKRLGSPIIAKAVNKQRAEGVFMIRSEEDWWRLSKGVEDDYVFQKYIEIEREYRLLTMGYEVKLLEVNFRRDYRKLKIEFENPDQPLKFLGLNKIPEGMKRVAEEASKLLGIEIAGVDACVEKGSGKIWLFEVNRGPGIVPDLKLTPELEVFAKFFEKELFG